MKLIYTICYFIGGCLILAACFATNQTATWIIGGIAITSILTGNIIQYYQQKNDFDNEQDIN